MSLCLRSVILRMQSFSVVPLYSTRPSYLGSHLRSYSLPFNRVLYQTISVTWVTLGTGQRMSTDDPFKAQTLPTVFCPRTPETQCHRTQPWENFICDVKTIKKQTLQYYFQMHVNMCRILYDPSTQMYIPLHHPSIHFNIHHWSKKPSSQFRKLTKSQFHIF